MHPLALNQIIRSVQIRIAQGDCPTEPRHSYEILEEVICDLANAALARRIAADPDDEPSAGGSPEPQPGDAAK